MLKEAALLSRNLLKQGNQIHSFILCLWELLWLHYGSGSRSAKAKSYGSYGFGSAALFIGSSILILLLGCNLASISSPVNNIG